MNDLLSAVGLEDLLLDANIIINLTEFLKFKDIQTTLDKDESKINLLSLSSSGRDITPDQRESLIKLEDTAIKLSDIYDFMQAINVFLTDDIKKQVLSKALELEQPGLLLDSRVREYIFLQISSKFGQALQAQASQRLLMPLIYKNMLRYVNDLLEKPTYQKSPFFEPIRDYVVLTANLLELKKPNHKIDNNADEKLVASVLDNILFNKRCTGLASNDGDVKKILEASYLIAIKARNVVRNKELDFLCSHPPIIYKVDQDAYLKDERLSLRFSDCDISDVKKNDVVCGYLSQQLLSLMKDIGFY